MFRYTLKEDKTMSRAAVRMNRTERRILGERMIRNYNDRLASVTGLSVQDVERVLGHLAQFEVYATSKCTRDAAKRAAEGLAKDELVPLVAFLNTTLSMRLATINPRYRINFYEPLNRIREHLKKKTKK